MHVALQPLQYIQQPEHWGTEVVGFVGDLIIPSDAPYTISMFVEGVMGTRGIEVIGATGTRRIDVPAAPAPGGWYAVHDHQPPGPAALRVRGSCEFPTEGYAPKLVRREPQGINPREMILDLVVKPPRGHGARVVTSVEVAYTATTQAGYDTVTIMPAGLTIPVRIVS